MNGFLLSPDETKVLFFADIKYGQCTVDVYPDLPKATGRIVDDLMYKHWDEWVETIPHPFIASFDGRMMGEATDIMAGEPYECPMKPFNGVEDFSWSPDGKKVAYASRKKQVWSIVSQPIPIFIYMIWKRNRLLIFPKE